jgi:hypothetical protein
MQIFCALASKDVVEEAIRSSGLRLADAPLVFRTD